jgi:hypothetical protein
MTDSSERKKQATLVFESWKHASNLFIKRNNQTKKSALEMMDPIRPIVLFDHKLSVEHAMDGRLLDPASRRSITGWVKFDQGILYFSDGLALMPKLISMESLAFHGGFTYFIREHAGLRLYIRTHDGNAIPYSGWYGSVHRRMHFISGWKDSNSLDEEQVMSVRVLRERLRTKRFIRQHQKQLDSLAVFAQSKALEVRLESRDYIDTDAARDMISWYTSYLIAYAKIFKGQCTVSQDAAIISRYRARMEYSALMAVGYMQLVFHLRRSN